MPTMKNGRPITRNSPATLENKLAALPLPAAVASSDVDVGRAASLSRRALIAPGRRDRRRRLGRNRASARFACRDACSLPEAIAGGTGKRAIGKRCSVPPFRHRHGSAAFTTLSRLPDAGSVDLSGAFQAQTHFAASGKRALAARRAGLGECMQTLAAVGLPSG